MSRKLRLEAEDGVYHVINRGNYRSELFRTEKAKEAFLKCLDQACTKTGWRVHGWCLMSNHYHLALETPRANLVEGMGWLQGTFSSRFNRFRKEHGHLFQGRYKSLIVEPGEGLGPLCHYIHLNPIRAKICTIDELVDWPWSSANWLTHPKKRPPWFDAQTALTHAGELADTAVGRKKYIEYLGWLSEDEAAQKAQYFQSMSKGWAVGTIGFKKSLHQEHKEVAAALKRGDLENITEAVLKDQLERVLQKLGKTYIDIARENKSAPWKLAAAATLKRTSTATNRWLGEHLNLGALHEVSRKVSQWTRQPDHALLKKLQVP